MPPESKWPAVGSGGPLDMSWALAASDNPENKLPPLKAQALNRRATLIFHEAR